MSRPTTPNPISAPNRSSTAPHKKQHHHHHIPHRHHHRDKSVSQSTVLLSPLTKASSRNEGAPDLTSLLREEKEAKARERAEKRERDELRKRGWEKFQRERDGRRVGEEHLRSTLQSLSTLSTATTRRLDYTYYSLLSSFSTLSSTISSLSSLSSTTSSLLHSFQHQATDLDRDIRFQTSIHAHNTSTQASRLTALEKRMKVGIEKVGLLEQRMDAVREKVREQERREGEWVGRVRRRVRWCWGAAGTILILCVGVMLVRHWPRVEMGVERFANRTIEGSEWEGMGLEKKTSAGMSSRVERVEHSRSRGSDHPVLKMLDEL